MSRLFLSLALFAGSLSACSPGALPGGKLEESLVLATAVLGKNDDGSPKPLPARAGILTREGGEWRYRFFEDGESNVFHKVMAYGSSGLLTLGGSKAAVKIWRPDGTTESLWEADFGGKFSRMRDAEVADLYGDGKLSIAVGTHDQGVVAVLRPDGSGKFSVEELDRAPDTIVHEIEIGDLNGDRVLEIYATPTPPNKLDGTEQPGKVVRYVPSADEGSRGPVEVADLGSRHAKEILVADVDSDGRDELYVSVEAVSGGMVEIRRYDADTEATSENVVVRLDDKLCRFLTAGDVDGNGTREVVAATHKRGLFLLRPGSPWKVDLIASDSSGFEHASILADLDKDGRDELYVASDDQGEVRRYDWTAEGWKKEVLVKFDDGLGRFTWNLAFAPLSLLPPAS
jgi:hypothetical protein